MRWDDFRRSDNVEDRRDSGDGGDGGVGPGGGGLGGGFGIPIGRGGLGIGTVIVVTLLGWVLGVDPSILLDVAGGRGGGMGGVPPGYERVERMPPGYEKLDRLPPGYERYERMPRLPPGQDKQGQVRRTAPPKDAMGDFVSAVLGAIDDRWSEIFKAEGSGNYRGARIVLFRGATDARQCGMAQSQMGPFYCPPSRQIYLDTSFFDDIERKFRGCSGKACKFTQAYIIAHEAGHHIQNTLGILDRAQREQERAGGRGSAAANRIQVRVELQADCFAGVWANRQKAKSDFLEAGDVDAALSTAAAIGDDTLQRKSQGRVVPESFTHGSAEQRKRWFMTGFNSGQVSSCNTFAAQTL